MHCTHYAEGTFIYACTSLHPFIKINQDTQPIYVLCIILNYSLTKDIAFMVSNVVESCKKILLNQDIFELRSFDQPIFILQQQSASHMKDVMFSFHFGWVWPRQPCKVTDGKGRKVIENYSPKF